MYQIVWTPTAEQEYFSTLEYWTFHNQSNTYSLKIIAEMDALLGKLAENPFFLSRFVQSINLYRRVFLKGKFIIYYDVVEDSKIIIKYFKSNYQKPLSDDFNL